MTAAARSRRVAPPQGVARLLAGLRSDGPLRLEDQYAVYGPPALDPNLIDEVEASGLRGRGGGGFPTGVKLAAVAAAPGRPVVVVNAAEGEPASSKDRALLRCVPHLVLDGAAAAAAALRAHDVVVAVGRRGRAEQGIVSAAIGERRDGLRWQVVAVPDAFVAGEETALLAALRGAAPRPTTKPPYPFERGLGGAPTLVQNAETLAHVALIDRFGARWFREVGTDADPGTALVTLSGAVARPGVHEVEQGVPLTDLVARAGGATDSIGAYLVGGYFGGWTRDGSAPLTATDGLGAGVVVAFPESACAVAEAARVARYLADESAGQCGPCVHGLGALANGLEAIAGGRGDDRDRLRRWAGEVVGRGACRHPDGAGRFVASTLETFGDELAHHLRHGRCRGRDRHILQVGGGR